MTKTEPMPIAIRDTLVKLACDNAPREVCGFIHPDWHGITVLENIAERDNRFEIADGALLEFYGSCPDPLGFFHSHPSGRRGPSDVDAMYAPRDMRYWIVTPDDVYEWDMSNDPPAAIA